jgi:hypothetical protein
LSAIHYGKKLGIFIGLFNVSPLTLSNLKWALHFGKNTTKLRELLQNTQFSRKKKICELLLMPVLQRKFGLQPIFDRIA